MATTNKMRQSSFLPAGMGEKLQHRLIEFAGVGMMAVAIALIFALASYSANDPSLNTAALGDNVSNLLGPAGALTKRSNAPDIWPCVAALRLFVSGVGVASCDQSSSKRRVVASKLVALRIALARACLIAFRRTGSLAPSRWAWRSCRRPCSFLDPRPLARFHSALVLRHRLLFDRSGSAAVHDRLYTPRMADCRNSHWRRCCFHLPTHGAIVVQIETAIPAMEEARRQVLHSLDYCLSADAWLAQSRITKNA